MGWLDNAASEVRGAVDSVADSVRNSADQIADSSGDFVRALGRGDIVGAGEDLLAIGWEAWNIYSLGQNNIVADFLKRNLLPKLPKQDYQDRKLMTRSPSDLRRIAYGTTRMGGKLVYAESSGDDNKYLSIVVVFASHSCSDISRVYFNDELAFIGSTAQGKYQNLAVMSYETGKQTTANSTAVSLSPSGWTDSHKLLGITYAYFRLEYDNEVFSGLPNIDALIVGNDEIYDPRTGTTGYTDNQALIVRDFLIKDYGYNYDDIDEDSFIDGANYCDELVTTGQGGNEKRYTVNGSVSIQDEPQAALNALNAAGASYCVFTQGLIKYVAGVYIAPTQSYSEPDFISGLQILPTIGASERINAISGSYIDPQNNYEETDFVPIEIEAYISNDKQELRSDSTFPFSNSGTLARRLAKLYLEQSRFGVTLSAKMNFKMLQHNIGDRINISIGRIGWVNRIFRITSIEMGLQGVDVTLQEDSADVWDWQEGDALVVEVPPALELPDGSFSVQPQNVIISESLYKANDQKTIRSRVNISWDGDVVTKNYQIEGSFESGGFVTLSDYLTAPSFQFDDAQVGEWQFRIRSQNNIGSLSDWTYVDFTTLGKTAPPEDVAGFIGVVNPYGIEFKWNRVADIDIDYYEIRIGNNWETGQTLQTLPAISWTWETRPTGLDKAFIKAVDTTGNYSANAAQAQMEILNPKPVAPLTASVIDNNVLLRWADATTSFAIDFYDIKRGDSIDVANSVGVSKSTFANLFETESNTYTYWVAGVDIEGNKGEYVAIQANVDQPPDFTLQSDRLIDLSLGTSVNALDEIGVSISFDQDDVTVDNNSITMDLDSSFVILAPVNTTETWQEHFESLPNTGDNSIQALHPDNGYPYYLQPTPSMATYEQVIDFEGNFTLSRIKITPDTEILAGSPSVVFYVAYSGDGVTYVESEGLEANGVDFRYVRIRAEVASTSGLDLLKIKSIRLKLDVKLRTDEGAGESLAIDSGGTLVKFNTGFVDVISIQVTPNSTNSYNAVYDFVDTPNPESFKVLIFDENGIRQDSSFSWTARGI